MKEAKQVQIPVFGAPAAEGRQRRLRMRPKRRRAALLLCALLFLLSLAYCIKTILPREESVQTARFSYTASAEVKDWARLRPNELYPEGLLEEGRLIPDKLLDALEFEFHLLWEGDGTAEISGHYELSAHLQGYQAEGEARNIVYERRELLAQGEIPQQSPQRAEVRVPLRLSPADYISFFSQAELLIDSRPAKEIELRFEGRVTAQSAHGRVETPFSQTVRIPLGSNLYRLTKSEAMRSSDGIYETEHVTRTATTKEVIVAVLPALLLLLALLLLRFSVGHLSAEEELRLQIAQIRQKYGSRMVRVQEPPEFEGRSDVELQGIFDLVKMADEAGRPICYCPAQDGRPRNGLYYVQDANLRYVWRLPPPP